MAADNTNDTVIVQTGTSPRGSVIWLHGLGADGHDFEAIVPELRLPETLPLKFVFPHAPERPVTVNGGMVMRAWYDIVSLDAAGRADADGIGASSSLLDDLVQAEIDAGCAAANIVVAGFSQGGAIAIHNVLERQGGLAGLMALSAYMALPDASQDSDLAGLPVFAAHGTLDPMVPFQAGQITADRLRALGGEVEWHEYPMAHGVCTQEIYDIRDWLLSVFAA